MSFAAVISSGAFLVCVSLFMRYMTWESEFPAPIVRIIYLGLAEKLWWFVITSGLTF